MSHAPDPEMMAYDGFDERPFLVFWEITRACALACKHCRAEAQRHPHELNREASSRLIQQLAEMKPLMRRDCLDLVPPPFFTRSMSPSRICSTSSVLAC